jgi:predicted DCC family thiol-disulfide oxidoreductase YuxK
MKSLTVEYDGRCGLCCAMTSWLRRQPQLVRLTCVPADHRGAAGKTDLVVTADTGEVWTGDEAWLMVLWALSDYRHWAYRLASPALLPLARTMFAKLSAYRGSLSCALDLSPEVS